MKEQQGISNRLNITLWIAQIAIAGLLVWASATKLFTPVEELSAMWPWTGQVPFYVVKITGIIDLLAAIGLVFPTLLRIAAGLTPLAGGGIAALMVCAMVFHLVRGESNIGINIVLALIGVFIAWGRWKERRSS